MLSRINFLKLYFDFLWVLLSKKISFPFCASSFFLDLLEKSRLQFKVQMNLKPLFKSTKKTILRIFKIPIFHFQNNHKSKLREVQFARITTFIFPGFYWTKSSSLGICMVISKPPQT